MSRDLPSNEELLARCHALDERQKKIVTATIAQMIEHSHRVREREWVSEMFARIVGSAFSEDEPEERTPVTATSNAIQSIEDYAKGQAPTLLPLAFDIFGQVALGLQQRGGPITAEAAMTEVLNYLG